MFRTIGPVWDGNEVWLVVAGAAMFAAFPTWYATMFSGFYLALLLLLVFLIVRVLSFEWRERHEHSRWLGVWAWANTIGSLGAALIWGVAFSNLLYGVPINSSGDFDGTFWDLFSPYTLLGGVAVVLLFAFHGATYLTLRTTGELCRARRGGRRSALDRDGRRRRRVPDLDRRGRGRPQRQGRLPAAAARAARDRRTARRRRLRPARPQRLGVRAHGGRRLPRRGDDLHEPLPARHGRQQRLRQQPHRRQRLLGALHAQGDERRGADRRRRSILLYQGWTYHVFRARLSAARSRRASAGRPRASRDRRLGAHCEGLDPRLVRRAGAVRALLALDAALGVVAALLVLAQAVLIATVAARAFGGAGLDEVAVLLALLVAVSVGRAAAASGFEIVGRRAATDVLASLAARARRAAAARPPVCARRRRERRGGDGCRRRSRRARDDLRPLSAAGRPRRHGPGRRARLRRGDRPRLRGSDAADAAARAGLHVADRPLHGAARPRAVAGAGAARDALPRRRPRPADAARVQPRGGAGGAGSRAVSEQYRRTTMATLRVAFLSGTVLELAATLGIALVAVTVGVRLVEGGIGFEAGLTVLVLAPELYLPLRNLAAQFHASADGLAVAKRLLDLVDVEAPARVGNRRRRRAPPMSPCGSRASRSPTRRGPRGARRRRPRAPPGRDGGARRPERRREEHDRLAAPAARRAGRRAGDGGQASIWPTAPRSRGARGSRGCRSARRSFAAPSPTTSGSASPRPASRACMPRRPARAPTPSCRRCRTATTPSSARAGGRSRPESSSGSPSRARFSATRQLVILDEPTANLDPASAELVSDAVERLRAGRTVLLIVHRA